MQVYECGGWRWNTKYLPTQNNYWYKYKNKICVRAKNKFAIGTADSGFKKEKIISTQEFYNVQNPPITPKMLKEINDWFENGK